MEKVVKHFVVPAEVTPKFEYDEEVIIADDGTEFYGNYAEKNCIRYETLNRLNKGIENIPKKYVNLLDQYKSADAYYIKNNQEMNAVLDYLKYTANFDFREKERDEFFVEEDWYFFYTECPDDSANRYYVYNLSDYKERIDDFLDQFK